MTAQKSSREMTNTRTKTQATVSRGHTKYCANFTSKVPAVLESIVRVVSDVQHSTGRVHASNGSQVNPVKHCYLVTATGQHVFTYRNVHNTLK